MFSPHVVNSTESSIFQVAKWIFDFTAAQICSKFWILRCRLWLYFLTNKVVVQPISIHQIAEVYIWVPAVHFDTNLTSKIFLNPFLAKKILRYQKFIDSLWNDRSWRCTMPIYVQVKCVVLVQLHHQYTDSTAVQYVCPCGRFNQIWTAVRWRYTRGVTASVGLGHSTQDL